MSGFYELKTSTSGQLMFNLKAENNQVIIASVMKNSPSEKVVESES